MIAQLQEVSEQVERLEAELLETQNQAKALLADNLNRTLYGNDDPTVREIQARERRAAYAAGFERAMEGALSVLNAAMRDAHSEACISKGSGVKVHAARRVYNAMVNVTKEIEAMRNKENNG